MQVAEVEDAHGSSRPELRRPKGLAGHRDAVGLDPEGVESQRRAHHLQGHGEQQRHGEEGERRPREGQDHRRRLWRAEGPLQPRKPREHRPVRRHEQPQAERPWAPTHRHAQGQHSQHQGEEGGRHGGRQLQRAHQQPPGPLGERRERPVSREVAPAHADGTGHARALYRGRAAPARRVSLFPAKIGARAPGTGGAGPRAHPPLSDTSRRPCLPATGMPCGSTRVAADPSGCACSVRASGGEPFR